MGLLTGKTAVITGGSCGIAPATAQRCLADGAHYVLIAGRRQAGWTRLVAAFERRTHRAEEISA